MFKKAGLCMILKKYTTQASIVDNINIVSAIRTPIGLVNGSLSKFNTIQLGALALKESLLRAKVPPDDVQNIFVGCAFDDFSSYELSKQLFMFAGLPESAEITSISVSGIQSVVNVCNFLLSKKEVCAVVGMESISSAPLSKIQGFVNDITQYFSLQEKLVFEDSGQEKQNYCLRSYDNLATGYKSGVFQDEIVKVSYRKKGEQVLVSEDDSYRRFRNKPDQLKEDLTASKLAELGDGAAALVIATDCYVKRNNLTPLAKIISVAEDDNSKSWLEAQTNAIKQVLKVAKYNIEDITQWEVDDFYTTISLACSSNLNISQGLFNSNGGSYSLGYPIGMSGARILCHLIHSLPERNVGCAAACNIDKTASAAIIQKMNYQSSEKPRLTLYTKYPCQLCDELKEQLKPFEDRFILNETDIEADENKNIRKLYRYEIPVLFLDGVYLCKHRLDVDYFGKRLIKSEKACAIRRFTKSGQTFYVGI